MKTQNRQYVSYDSASTLHLQAFTWSESPWAPFMRRRHSSVLEIQRIMVKFAQIVSFWRKFPYVMKNLKKMKLSESCGDKMGFESLESN